MARQDKKVVKQKEQVSVIKSPTHIENPVSFMSKSPIWSFKLIDNDYDKWGFANVKDMNRDVITKLRDFEGMTWSEILKTSGAKSHGNNSHYEDISALTKDAQKRWIELNLEEYDQVFSLRLTNTHRLYGLIDNGIFKVIWYDQRHEIYPVTK